MTVMEQLGQADLERGLADARLLWPGWADQNPRLQPAPAVHGLQEWLLSAQIDAADDVLHALVRIGSPSGANSTAAAWVAVWALLPGASAVARGSVPGVNIDALVASQLWLEVREFPWWRHQKVAGNVLANIRSAVARDGALKRPSWAERRTVLAETIPEQSQSNETSAAEELADVLAWGEQIGLITVDDRMLLSSLMEQTDRLPARTVCRNGQGLMSASALAGTAAELGLSPGAVRRRARRSIDALASASRSGQYSTRI